MQPVTIPLEQLEAHPANSNVMSVSLFEKLKAHLTRTKRYPPLIVRRLSCEGDPPRYQLLDGHHR